MAAFLAAWKGPPIVLATTMSLDVTDLRSFYASPLGSVTRRLVGRAIDRFWGPLTGLRIMGLGYATPYLAAVRPEGERTLAFMPATQGVVNWPGSGPPPLRSSTR